MSKSKERKIEFGLIITEIPIYDPAVNNTQFIVKNSWEFYYKFQRKSEVILYNQL